MSCATPHNLEENRFFAPFASPWRDRLLALAKVERFADGDVLFEEGEDADGVLLVLEGSVALVRLVDQGQLINIHQVKAGDFFGELAVLDEQGRSAQAVALGNLEVARLPKKPLLEVLNDAPGEAIMELFRGITSQVRSSNDRFVHEVLQRERLATLGGMAASIIHDFKSPLTGVELASQLLESRYRGEEEVSRYCRSIRQQSARMTALAQELLDYSRGKPELHRSDVDLRELFEELEELNLEYFKAKQVQLGIGTAEGVLWADRSRLLRVMQNLISNAVAAFAGQAGTIRIESRRSGGREVAITVTDDGPGIPPDILGRIFEPFCKSAKSQGSGLGMAIAKTVVEAHGGQISVRSQPGQGSTFEIRLPLKGASGT